MLVKEMHIEVIQSLQKQGARITRKFLPQEIDWALNKALLKFRDSRIRRKQDNSGLYEIDQMHLDALRVWLKTQQSLSSYISPDGMSVYSYLPPDYAYLIADSSFTADNCIPNYNQKVTGNLYVQGADIKSVIPTNAPVTSVSLTVGLSEVLSFTGLSIPPAENYTVYNLLKSSGYLYFEDIGNSYYSNKFLSVFPNATDKFVIAINGNTVVSSQMGQTTSVQSYIRIGNNVSDNRMTTHSILKRVNGTEFYTSSAESPISGIDGTFLRVYVSNNFTVSGTLIDYIRRPRKISITLDQHCELPEEFHQEICDLAVEFMMLDMADGRIQLKQQENVTRG